MGTARTWLHRSHPLLGGSAAAALIALAGALNSDAAASLLAGCAIAGYALTQTWPLASCAATALCAGASLLLLDADPALAAMSLMLTSLLAGWLLVGACALGVSAGAAVGWLLVGGSRDGLWTVALACVLACALLAGARRGMAEEREQLLRQARSDPLTGLANRRGLEEQARSLRALALRRGDPTTVAVIDLDGFKDYNDRNGHPGGDALLAGLAAAWSSALRAGDVLARIGGDEFCLVLPGSSREQAHETLERMRMRSQQVSVETWSAGVSSWEAGEELELAVSRADGRLYRAKRSRDENN